MLLAFKLFTAYFLTCKQPEPRYSNSWQTFKSSEESLCVLDLNQSNDTGTENLENFPATKRFIASLGKAVITKAQLRNTIWSSCVTDKHHRSIWNNFHIYMMNGKFAHRNWKALSGKIPQLLFQNQTLPFHICRAGSPQSTQTGWRSAPASLHCPANGNRRLKSFDKKHFTHLTPQFSYFQAGMHHSIFPRQAEVYWSSKRGPQFLADHAYRKTYISFLHLPEGTNNHMPLSTGKQLHIFLRKCEHNTTNRRGVVGLKSKDLQTSTTPSDSYFIFPVRILPAYCIPVRAMYILRISLVPCEQTVELDLS